MPLISEDFLDIDAEEEMEDGVQNVDLFDKHVIILWVNQKIVIFG